MPVTVDISDHIATITIDQPPVNALGSQISRELTEAFFEIGAGKEAHVAVLRASGEKIFSAGADIKETERRYALKEASPEESAYNLVDPGTTPRNLFMAAFDCPVPIISSVQGICLGAGLALIACTDIIIASERATFGLPEMGVGVLGGGRFLQRLVGVPKMRRMFYTSETVTADEMYRLGALDSVVEHETLEEKTRELALKIASKSPIGLRLGKLSLNRAEHLSLADGYRIEQDYTGKASGFKDSAEARNSWREKREPNWTWS
ncbi:MAG: putative enoyl-CoA hydratase [Microbacteriaceae bacterium]|nr:putative enoyl-CoA hydratase [Microbacteriaceae bacterium]